MAWTQADVDDIDAAILQLAKDGGVKRVRHSDGSEVEYDLAGLVKLREVIKSSVGGSAAGAVRTTLASFTKD